MKIKRILRIALTACLIPVLIFAVGILVSLELTSVHYTVSLDGIVEDITIVLLSDLHAREYGENNTSLLRMTEEQQPDIIALVGDIFSRDDTEDQIAEVISFVSTLTDIAPVYYSLGNHEQDYISVHGEDVLEQLSAAGAAVLNDVYMDLTINGSVIRLGGMDRMAYTGGDGQYDPLAQVFLMDFCSTDLPTVLLSHRPEFFSFKEACKEWDVDLILSGHTHGGLVRLPLIGGLYAPIQEWFPKTDYGEYNFFGTRMIVTSGLAGYNKLPRVFNPSEVCVVTIIKAD